MCNLYNISTNQEAIRALTKALDRLGNLEPSLNVYPDQLAPVVRNKNGEREAGMLRWGMPASQKALFDAASKRAQKLREKGRYVDFDQLLKSEPDRGTTNIRNTASAHWKRWLGVDNRCVVPFTRFAEPDPASKPEGGPTPNAWFAGDASEPLMVFAGIWVAGWESVRKVKDGSTRDDLFGFLTTEPNGVVAPVHQKAMPVILKTPEEIDIWLTTPWEEAKVLQRPSPDSELVRV